MSTSICACPHCDQQIEFPVENSGEAVSCPHCGKDLTLPNEPTAEYEIVSAASPPPVSSDAETALNDNSVLSIRLNSGAELRIKAIRLYDEIDLAELNKKKAEAMKLLQGVSTGLGAIGSLEWVLAASVAIGLAEAALSTGAESVGGRLLAEAIEAEQKLREKGVFKPVGIIREIENPLPGLWRVPTTRVMQFSVQVRAFPLDKTETRTKTVPSAYIHIGDDFICVQTDDDSVCSIRWSAVESYQKKSIVEH
jgi:hypothetical protein